MILNFKRCCYVTDTKTREAQKKKRKKRRKLTGRDSSAKNSSSYCSRIVLIVTSA